MTGWCCAGGASGGGGVQGYMQPGRISSLAMTGMQQQQQHPGLTFAYHRKASSALAMAAAAARLQRQQLGGSDDDADDDSTTTATPAAAGSNLQRAGSVQQQQQLGKGARQQANSSPLVRATTPDARLGSVTDCVLGVTVRNDSGHYFRAWLARVQDLPPIDQPLSLPGSSSSSSGSTWPPGSVGTMQVLQPGDSARLVCVIPSAMVAPLGSSSGPAAGGAAAGGGSGAAADTARRSLVGPLGSSSSRLLRGLGSSSTRRRSLGQGPGNTSMVGMVHVCTACVFAAFCQGVV